MTEGEKNYYKPLRKETQDHYKKILFTQTLKRNKRLRLNR